MELSWFELVYYRLYMTYILMEFLFGLDKQSNVCSSDFQKIEGLIRCCLPIPQKLHNVTKRLKTTKEVEQYIPAGFLALMDCTAEHPIYTKTSKKQVKTKTILPLWQEKETHAR
jgi:hypothetical protein